ncbi:MAG: VOC family protein [Solirubrobacteraceae bacterium]
MLGLKRAFGGFSVDDVPAAREFYGGTLGLDVEQLDNGLLALHLPGAAETIVYPKPDHRPAAFTILNFAVEDIEYAIDELRSRDVEMLFYDGFDQDERGISRQPGGPPIAWFSDPAGNILALLQE